MAPGWVEPRAGGRTSGQSRSLVSCDTAPAPLPAGVAPWIKAAVSFQVSERERMGRLGPTHRGCARFKDGSLTATGPARAVPNLFHTQMPGHLTAPQLQPRLAKLWRYCFVFFYRRASRRLPVARRLSAFCGKRDKGELGPQLSCQRRCAGNAEVHMWFSFGGRVM